MTFFNRGKILIIFLIPAIVSGLLFFGQIPAKADAFITVSGKRINSMGTKAAIQEALDQARDNASEGNPYIIQVEPGDYELDGTLSVYSYTTLDLTGVTLTRISDGNMIKVGSTDTASSGKTGYYYKEIYITGGTLDGNNMIGTLLKTAHMQNFYLSGTTLKNAYLSHLMEAGGINGLYVSDCAFENQTINSEYLYYEALQLDILYSSHIAAYRSEPLENKNIFISDCLFDNVPRGIGSHSAILNLPMNNISITGCTFSNTESAAIQTLNWTDVTIENNTFINCVRGISIYTVMGQGQGMFTAETIAKEGGLKTDISSEYMETSDSNIVIKNNTITVNSLEDVYANYLKTAIGIFGAKITSSDKTYSDGSGNMPKGDFTTCKVTISGNRITAYGHGIRISYGKDCTIENNVINCREIVGTKSNYYGIQVCASSEAAEIRMNTIKGAQSNGILISGSSTALLISDNKIIGAGKHGIGIDGGEVGSITSNRISSAQGHGIYIRAGAKVSGEISKNIIIDPGKNDIEIENFS